MLFFRFSRSFFSCFSLPFLFGWVFLGFAAAAAAVGGLWLAVLLWAVAPVPFLLWFGVFRLLRWALFVRFPAPPAPVSSRGARWFPLPSSSPWFPVRRWWSPRWLCVPAAAVPGWLRLVGSGAVAPAVVSRRSGVLLFAWVLVPCVRVRGGWSPLFWPPVGG